MIAAILAVAALQMTPSLPGSPPDPPTNGGGERWGVVSLDYERDAINLRTEMRALQEADGGQLTPQHRAYVKKKVEALLNAYRRDAERPGPTAINADGSRPR